MQTNITAIVVTYNSARVLPVCLDALSLQNIATIVVDNASADHSVLIARNHNAQVIQLEKNLGYGIANNIGARASKTEYLLIINPDVVVQPGAMGALAAAAGNNLGHALFSPKIIEPDERVFDKRLGLLGPFASGACFLIRRDVFLRLGGFDENIFLFYEDDDLCRRLTDMNMPPIYVETALVRHDRGRSTNDHDEDTPIEILIRGEFIRRYHQAWSKFYVLKKYRQSGSVLKWIFFYGFKYFFATITFQKLRRARYAGSFYGAIHKKRRFG